MVDPETGIKKNNRIRLNGATSRTDAIKAVYDVLMMSTDTPTCEG